ncbi:uncharacterized protein LOC141659663 [Apium graveolens]|uniref:uncharacterized protein LOC141659663 n=1 Tax=Apium graveolens TaxID=4045 RepID=UPI003D79F743
MSQMKKTVFATKMGGKFLWLLVLLLAFSQLLSLSTAVPITRTRRVMYELRDPVLSEDDRLAHMEKRGKVEGINGRTNIGLNDYPGSGANNRHTPRRGCIEC